LARLGREDLLKRLLLARTQGNPLFLEESVRSLVDEGVLVGDRGAYQLVKPPEIVHVPPTVQAILAARIDRLPPEDKALLQTASVVGNYVPVAVLAGVAGAAADALAEGLGRLRAAEFLYETSLFPDAEYTFKHALTQEVSYGSLLHDRRRALHAQVLAAMEDAGYGRLSLNTERLAHHALKGEEWARAAKYLHLAGRRAIAEARYAVSASTRLLSARWTNRAKMRSSTVRPAPGLKRASDGRNWRRSPPGNQSGNPCRRNGRSGGSAPRSRRQSRATETKPQPK
jgi:predicted ATPase